MDKVTNFGKKIEVLKSKHTGNTWSSDGTVPKGWKYRMIKAKNGKRIMYFQTKEGTDLSERNQVKLSTGKKIFMFLPPKTINFMGKQTVLEYMKKNNIDDSDSEKVIFFVSKYKSKDHTWQSDESVPVGWKYRMVNAKNGRKVMFFQNGEGTKLSGRVHAIDFMHYAS